jgi:hypothetical protein
MEKEDDNIRTKNHVVATTTIIVPVTVVFATRTKSISKPTTTEYSTESELSNQYLYSQHGWKDTR